MTKITLQGIAWDEKSSYQRGPAKAPPLIRKALHSGSMNLGSELGRILNEEVLHDAGDFLIQDYFDIERITAKHLAEGNKVFSLGGDHSMTYPIMRAYAKHYPELAILQIDAHSDLYAEFEGDPHSHACPFARIMEKGLAARLVQVGIRTLNPHQAEQAERFGVEIHEMKTLDLSQPFHFQRPLYLTLDLDGLDPAYAPGVSHHEPGGLTSREVISLIQRVEANIVGADIVEYNPDRDHRDMTAFLAAKLLKEIVGRML
ncbi:MAG: agmatinase [Bacteroidota bacterium]